MNDVFTYILQSLGTGKQVSKRSLVRQHSADYPQDIERRPVEFGVVLNDCMVAIIQHETKTEMSIYEVLETVSMVLTEKTPLYDLLCNSNDNIDNELDESSEPTLF